MRLHYFDPSTEQGVLRVSIAVTMLMTLLGVVFGLLATSLTIIFDAVYELIDVAMTILALMVARLIATSRSEAPGHKRLADRFTMGFWHLEPIVLGVNGLLLVGAALYGLISAVDSIMTGGRELSFDYALIYAVITLLVEIGMWYFVRRANRRIGSDFLKLDAQGWSIGIAITVGYLLAFSAGYLAQGTRFDAWTAYLDPAVLAVVCLAVIPVPFGTVRQALADVLLVTPPDFKRQIDEVARTVVQRYGFATHRAYVARVGRGRQIELYFVVPEHEGTRPLTEWDRIREEISEAIGDDTPDRWLTIVFTCDPVWTR